MIKKKVFTLLLVCALLLGSMPVHAAETGQRLPIYSAYSNADYLASQVLKEIPTAGKDPREQIRAVYDWIILNCVREYEEWDGTIYFDEAEIEPLIDAYLLEMQDKVDSGEALVRHRFDEPYEIARNEMTHLFDGNTYVSQNAYDMMVYRYGNCVHYSALLAVLLSNLGYDTRLVAGTFINSDGSTVEHKWNLVLLGGKYYWLDVRMDHEIYARTGKIEYRYFMVEDTEQWAKKHTWNRTYFDWYLENAAYAEEYYFGSVLPADVTLEGSAGTGSQGDQTGSIENTGWSRCSDWAVPYLTEADANGLIPAALTGLDFTAPITRQEFAAVSMGLYTALGGRTVKETPIGFSDCADEAVLQAASVGIVTGMGNGLFQPQGLLTREQAVTMLGRACEAAYSGRAGDGSGFGAAASTFTDEAAISAYAKPYVAHFSSIGAITGGGDGSFDPHGNMTREQAVKVAVAVLSAAVGDSGSR